MPRVPWHLMPPKQKRAVILKMLREGLGSRGRTAPPADDRAPARRGRGVRAEAKTAAPRASGRETPWYEVSPQDLMAPVARWRSMSDKPTSSNPLLVELENGVRGVLKGGSVYSRQFGDDLAGGESRREAFAYALDQALGFGTVPPVVYRGHAEGAYSVMVLVPGATPLSEATPKMRQLYKMAGRPGRLVKESLYQEAIDELRKVIPRDQLERVGVVQYLLGQGDGHFAQYMLTPERRLIAVDNGLTMSKSGGMYGSASTRILELARSYRISPALKAAVRRTLTHARIDALLKAAGLPKAYGRQLKERRDLFVHRSITHYNDLLKDTFDEHQEARKKLGDRLADRYHGTTPIPREGEGAPRRSRRRGGGSGEV